MIKKALLLSLLGILSTSISLQSQSFRAYYLRADSLLRAEQYVEADLMYDKAFELREVIDYGFYYNSAYSAALAGKKKKSIRQFEKLVRGGYINFNSITKEEKLVVLHMEKEWNSLLKLIEELEKSIDRKLVETLRVIDDKDQMFRQLSNCREKQLSKNQQRLLQDFIRTQDSLNLVSVTQIITQHGWPGKDMVGAPGNGTVWLVIQHADIAVQEKYIPLLKQSVLAGQSAGKHLALLQDRILVRKGEKQIYGSQIYRDKETKLYAIHPIEEVETVDQRRAAIGLPPMDEYLLRWKLSMKADYRPEIKD